ncbi:MAG: hypothetical protein QM765_39635 [Myxococcales bacterium]
MRPTQRTLAVSAALTLAAAALAPSSARADELATQVRRAQLEELRGLVASQIQLQAFDLLDELVYGWTQQPPFAQDTPLVLADVSVPIGFGSGMQALIENHFISLAIKNPGTKVTLAHCPQCLALVVHSGEKATVVARGFDAPGALSAAGLESGSRHALFLDFEIEGASLVLRARVTSLEPALPIVWAKTLSTRTSTPALLRSGEHLKTAEEARKEYLDTLENKLGITIPVRVAVRSFAAPNPGQTIALRTVPFVWIQTGLEVPFTQARAWTASVMGGVSWAPSVHTAWLAQARISRLLTGTSTSLTHPDLYVFLGGAVMGIYGLGALAFDSQAPSIDQLTAQLLGQTFINAQTIVGAFHLGLELRAKNRIGISFFAESLPGLDQAVGVGNFADLGIFKIHSLGAEVSFCF